MMELTEQQIDAIASKQMSDCRVGQFRQTVIDAINEALELQAKSNIAELTSPEYISRLRGVIGRGAGEQFGYRVRRIDPNEGPSVWRFADKDDAEICMRYRETYEVEPLYASPVAGEVKG